MLKKDYQIIDKTLKNRREGNAPQPANRGSNAQPKFDPHFVSAPEATPLRSARKAPAAPAGGAAMGHLFLKSPIR